MAWHTPENRPLSDTELVENTLELYDPGRQTVVVGTSALLLQGVRLDYAVPDVDALGPANFIASLKASMYKDRLGGTSYFDEEQEEYYLINAEDRVLIEPNVWHAKGSSILPFQVHTDMRDETYAVNYKKVMVSSVVHAPTGHMLMPIADVIAWKRAIGRGKDLKTIQGLSCVTHASQQLRLYELSS